MQKRILSAILCFIMLFTSVPVQEVHATEPEGGETPTYTVTYEENGATGGNVPASETLTSGSDYVIKAPEGEFIREDNDGKVYLFTGWNTLENGTGTDYAIGDQITITGDLTLYAKWILWQTEYEVKVVANLDGVPTNVTDIFPQENIQGVYVKADGKDYIELTNTDIGVYTTKVTENGIYKVYFKIGTDAYEGVHGHEVIIYNQSSDTVLQNYSVTYDLNGGELNESSDNVRESYHARSSAITVKDYEPVKSGYVFDGWEVGDPSTVLKAGDLITNEILAPVVLTAKWVALVDKVVHITIRHETADGTDGSAEKQKVILHLLKEEGEYNVPVGEPVTLNGESDQYGYAYDENKNETTYTYVFKNLPDGTYHIDASKSHYALSRNHEGGEIYLTYEYDPSSFDLRFDVKVDPVIGELLPKAVNVKVTYWGHEYDEITGEFDENGELGWQVITQQAGDKAPSSVAIDEDGNGSGFFPVWQYAPGTDKPCYYRVEVRSFVMPDGSILPAGTVDHKSYTVIGSGLYTGTVNVEAGKIPDYPEGGTTELRGSYYDQSAQLGIPTVTVAVNPMTVTFNPEGGKIGENEADKQVTLSNHYKYPDIAALTQHTPVWADDTMRFVGWYVDDQDENPTNDVEAITLAGQYLTGNVTLYAKWEECYTIQGTVYADVSYQLDGEDIEINKDDRVDEVMVILQRLTDGVWNDVKGDYVTIAYPTDLNDQKNVGSGTYEFQQPYDGTNYRIHVIALNYDAKYDSDVANNQDGIYTPDEDGENKFNVSGAHTINIHLDFNPESFEQMVILDTSRIHRFFRPTSAEVKIQGRDIISVDNYEVISQHQEQGMSLSFNDSGISEGIYSIWKYHTNGSLYEYKLDVSKLYGNVEGVFDAAGTVYSPGTAPYTIEYSIPTWWDESEKSATAPLHATFIPKEYKITFDLDVEYGEKVYGMSDFLTDSQGGTASMSAVHTWSYQDDLVAFPYREGYMFDGWVCVDENGHEIITQEVFINNQGYVTIGAGLSHDVILKAKWKEMTGTYYTVRYLLWDEDKDDSEMAVLHGAKLCEAQQNDVIKAINVYEEILGYKPLKVRIGTEIRVDWADDASLTVDSDNTKNAIIIYYKRDDGYVESADSNLHISKVATLEDDGTYSIKLETYTTDNPVTTQILNNTPLDIVMVLDQSGSVVQSGYLDELQQSVRAFIEELREHGRTNEVDHRVAIVGYASDETAGSSNNALDVYADNDNTNAEWVNTGVFDSNGEFHRYPVTGFRYTEYTGSVEAGGTYYAKDLQDNYLLLMHHDEYYHMLTEDEAKNELLNGEKIFGQIENAFVELRRNTSGLWLYGENSLYSIEEFFTYHEDVWTHRNGLERREIHAYGTAENYAPADGHTGVYTRVAIEENNPQLNLYRDALVPVSVGANGSGNINPMFSKVTIGSTGGTYAQYGMEMANKIFAQIPAEEAAGRLRIVVMFTDGQPGQSGYDETVANATVAQAQIAKQEHGAYVYTIGLYNGNQVDQTSETAIYMNAVSSNYPDAENVGDVYKSSNTYVAAGPYVNINDGNTYYVQSNERYYELSYRSWYGSGWYYNYYNRLTSTQNAYTDAKSQIEGKTIYVRDTGYVSTPYSGFYSTTESIEKLQEYFEEVFWKITTTITTEIVLHDDTIVRDVMGQGFELTENTKIDVYTQDGTYNAQTQGVDWAIDDKGKPITELLASLTIGAMPNLDDSINTANCVSDKKYTNPETEEETPYIQVYNLAKTNTTKPLELNYHPHTIDITGYQYNEYFINETHPNGKKVIVTISNVEARDDVVWGRSTKTNNEASGVWLPADSQGNRQMLLAFEQPTTIFVERAYVLDYAKSFELAEWYFDKIQDNPEIGAYHMDMESDDGMNWFDTAAPTVGSQALAQDGTNSNLATEYGKAQINDKVLTYEPVTMQWDGAEEFYVFGKTQRNTVKSQDANENGNLWTKVRVIPANNVYYEDSFVTTESANGENAVNGFKFTGDWQIVNEGQGPGTNKEQPETVESETGKGVHGWTDDLAEDTGFSDESAHQTTALGANVEFTFTGTGVDVYTRTNSASGMVVAVLSKISKDNNGETVETNVKSIAMDNLAVSGDYYSIPTISFQDLEYGTYKVKLIATAAAGPNGLRYEYYLDGIRVYNPLSATYEDNTASVRDAYGKEQNAVFQEVRDKLIDYKDFNPELEDDTDGKAGAVFIDWIKEGQEDTSVTPPDHPGTGVPTYSVGTFEAYGPKNEVYLSPGQAIVLKVDPVNTYYMGLKSLKGTAVTANVSGKDKNAVRTISINHSTDMYYEVTPVDGYLVIENGSDNANNILSITKLRTVNMEGTAPSGGILPITSEEAVDAMRTFALRMVRPEPDLPEEDDKPQQNPSKPSDDKTEQNPSKDETKQEASKPVEVILAPENNAVSESLSTSSPAKETETSVIPEKTETIAEMAVLEENEDHQRSELVDEEEQQEAGSEIISENNEIKKSEDSKGFFAKMIEMILGFFKTFFGWIGSLFGGRG